MVCSVFIDSTQPEPSLFSFPSAPTLGPPQPWLPVHWAHLTSAPLHLVSISECGLSATLVLSHFRGCVNIPSVGD